MIRLRGPFDCVRIMHHGVEESGDDVESVDDKEGKKEDELLFTQATHVAHEAHGHPKKPWL